MTPFNLPLRSSRIALAVLFLAGCALLAQDKQAPKFTGGDYTRYWMDVCARCHGATGNGRDAKGSQLPDAGFDFTDSRKANRKKDADWVKVMLDGKEKMPAFKDKMTEEEIRKMITEVLRPFAARS